jgi:hypothetical protein
MDECFADLEHILPKLGAHSEAQAVTFALPDGPLDDQRPRA